MSLGIWHGDILQWIANGTKDYFYLQGFKINVGMVVGFTMDAQRVPFVPQCRLLDRECITNMGEVAVPLRGNRGTNFSPKIRFPPS